MAPFVERALTLLDEEPFLIVLEDDLVFLCIIMSLLVYSDYRKDHNKLDFYEILLILRVKKKVYKYICRLQQSSAKDIIQNNFIHVVPVLLHSKFYAYYTFES